MTAGDNNHESIALSLRMSARMDEILDMHPTEFVLPTEAAREFKACGFIFWNQLNSVASSYSALGSMVFQYDNKKPYGSPHLFEDPIAKS